MSKKQRDYDKNILNNLTKLQWPLFNYENKKVYVRANARNEDGFQHIAGKCHLLKIRDIDLIPSVLKKPYKVVLEGVGKKGKSYYGKRKYKEKSPLLKIVVRFRNDGSEEIVTIYTTKSIKNR